MRYVTISLRRDLIDRVRKIVEAGIGYRSIADFVSEATRRRLEEIEPLLEKIPKAPSTPPAGGGCGAEGAEGGGMSPGARGGKEGG